MRSPLRFTAAICVLLTTATRVTAADESGPSIDVTAKIVALVKGNSLSLTVDGDRLGDPSPGDPKKLRIDYSIGGKNYTKYFAESQDISIIAAEKLTIRSAVFGVFGNPIDVTAHVVEASKEGVLKIKAENDLLGADPAPGDTKALTVIYTQGGAEQTQSVREGDTLVIERRPGVSLVIVEATWGEVAPFYEVTDRLTKAMTDGVLFVKVDKKLLGDPSVGNAKELHVEYSVAKTSHFVVVKEGETLRLPAPSDPNGPIHITKAYYGVLASN